jgi:hypothetical protein
MNVRAAVIAFWTAVLLATPARAQRDRWERQVRGQVERAAASLGASGVGKAFAMHVGMLNTDESEAFTLTLGAGISYVVVGTCDEHCSKLGLVLSDLSSHDLAADRASGNAPVTRLTPRETGFYRVKAVMATCRMNPCRYAVAVFTPPTP